MASANERGKTVRIKRVIQPEDRGAYASQLVRARGRQRPDLPLFEQRVEFALEEHLRAHDPPIVSRETIREICSAHDAALFADSAGEDFFEATVRELNGVRNASRRS